MRAVIIGALLCCPMMVLAEIALEDVQSAKGLPGFVTVDRLPIPKHEVLLQGRRVWEDTCMACHGGNKATGAPKITATKKWAPRIAQGLPTLIEHATNGFVGKTYAEMPARGGNTELSDTDVASAVAFMAWTSGGADQVLNYLETQRTN